MGKGARSIRLVLLAAIAGTGTLACAQDAPVDYSLAPRVRLASGLGGTDGAGLTLQAGPNWFGQVGVSHGTASELVAVAGGYRFGGGQALSLQLSRGMGAGQRLGLAVNYDWPRYFVRFSYDASQRVMLTPQESLRVSAGVRF